MANINVIDALCKTMQATKEYVDKKDYMVDEAYEHSQVAHAPANAQKNSDITKAEIEAKLTGTITSHNHSGTYAPASHNQTSSTINAMTGYSKPTTTSAIAATDSLNTAIGKLEKALDGKQSAGSYSTTGHTHDDRYYTESEINTKVSNLNTAISTAQSKAVADAKSYTDTAVANLVGTAPEALNTLNELAAALGDDPNFATTITEQIGGKADKSHGNHVPTTQTANNAIFLRNDNTWATVTPTNIGAAPSSHGTHVTWATNTPKANGTAAIGTVARVAREDHIHPLQTSVSGNAGSANKVNNNLVVKLNSGTTEGTNLFTFNGSAAKTINITPSSIGATRKYAANIGDGTNATIKVSHNLGTEDITISVREVATKQIVMADVQIVDSNSINILFNSAPTSGQYRVVVIG